MTQAIYRGPLPPPAVLEHFERVLPGAASRILATTEEQLRHRRSIESAIVTANTQALGRGQWFGLIVILAGMATGGCLVVSGHGLAGFGSLLAPLTAAAGMFVFTRRREALERERKRQRQLDHWSERSSPQA